MMGASLRNSKGTGISLLCRVTTELTKQLKGVHLSPIILGEQCFTQGEYKSSDEAIKQTLGFNRREGSLCGQKDRDGLEVSFLIHYPIYKTRFNLRAFGDDSKSCITHVHIDTCV